MTLVARHPNLAAIDDILSRARSPRLAAFLYHMAAIHPPDRLPARAAFDPIDVPRLLGNIVLAKVVRASTSAAPRFLIQVAGDEVLNAAPEPMMNRYLDDLVRRNERPAAQAIVDSRQSVVESGRTYYWFGPPRMKFRFDFADVEYCHCPLAEDGVTVDRVLSFFQYSGARPAL